jgi:hypothetical protein
MMTKKLWPTTDDFMASLDKGINLIQEEMSEPDEKDREALKAILAVFLASAMALDQDLGKDPKLDERLGSVRLAALAAYNLGKGKA